MASLPQTIRAGDTNTSHFKTWARTTILPYRYWGKWTHRYFASSNFIGKWPLPKEVEARIEIGAAYSRKLQAGGFTSTPQLAAGNTSVYASTRTSGSAGTNTSHTQGTSIPTAVHYPTLLCQQPALICEPRCNRKCATQIALSISKRVLSLPMHPWLTDEEQDRVVAAAKRHQDRFYWN